jgi:hypothetical protein
MVFNQNRVDMAQALFHRSDGDSRNDVPLNPLNLTVGNPGTFRSQNQALLQPHSRAAALLLDDSSDGDLEVEEDDAGAREQMSALAATTNGDGESEGQRRVRRRMT